MTSLVEIYRSRARALERYVRFEGHRRLGVYDDPRLLLDAIPRGRGLALMSRSLTDETLRAGDQERFS